MDGGEEHRDVKARKQRTAIYIGVFFDVRSMVRMETSHRWLKIT